MGTRHLYWILIGPSFQCIRSRFSGFYGHPKVLKLTFPPNLELCRGKNEGMWDRHIAHYSFLARLAFPAFLRSSWGAEIHFPFKCMQSSVEERMKECGTGMQSSLFLFSPASLSSLSTVILRCWNSLSFQMYAELCSGKNEGMWGRHAHSSFLARPPFIAFLRSSWGAEIHFPFKFRTL
jgi:hypothetical protein